MEVNQPSSLPSSSAENDPNPDPDDAVRQSVADEVSFGFNHLQIDDDIRFKTHEISTDYDMEVNQRSCLPSSSADNDSSPDPDDAVHQSVADEVSFGFNHLQIDDNNDIDDNEDNNDNNDVINDNDDSNLRELSPESTESDDEEDDEEDGDGVGDDDDFTFASVGDNSDAHSDEVFENGQIRGVFPLFDQSLILGGDLTDSGDVKRRLPIDVPVDKVFIESPRRSLTEYGSTDGTVQALQSESGTPEINIKSNSTGFSKLWRFRNEMNRSNSEGRDAFVFLESPGTAAANSSEAKQKTVSTAVTAVSTAVGGGSTAKVNVEGGGKGKVVQKAAKVKRSKASSAHEMYLKQKEGRTEEERRRSYLPYRPGLMGFFTNVNGGLSKNVHPF